MEHFLITRFNVPIPGWGNDKAGSQTLNEAWMQHRLALFRQYCAPTIAGQTIHNFYWLIYCSTHTSDLHIQTIREAIAEIVHAEIRLVNTFDELKKDLNQRLAFCHSPFIITSRVDNDDGLGNDFIRMVQDHFIPEDKTLINLSGGILYNLQKKILTELPNVRHNHFGSLIEKNDGTQMYLTIMGFAHHDPPDFIRVIHVKCRFAWLKIIHSRNLKSRTSGIPIFPGKALAHYAVEKKAIPVSPVHSVLYLVARVFKVLTRKITKKRK